MIQTTYNQIVTFLYDWHSQDYLLDKNISMALYGHSSNLYLFVNWKFFDARISKQGKNVWKVEGLKYEE